MLKKLKGLERGGGGEEDGDQGDAPKTPAKSKACQDRRSPTMKLTFSLSRRSVVPKLLPKVMATKLCPRLRRRELHARPRRLRKSMPASTPRRTHRRAQSRNLVVLESRSRGWPRAKRWPSEMLLDSCYAVHIPQADWCTDWRLECCGDFGTSSTALAYDRRCTNCLLAGYERASRGVVVGRWHTVALY